MSAPELIKLILNQGLVELITKLSTIKRRMLSHHDEEDHCTSKQIYYCPIVWTF